MEITITMTTTALCNNIQCLCHTIKICKNIHNSADNLQIKNNLGKKRNNKTDLQQNRTNDNKICNTNSNLIGLIMTMMMTMVMPRGAVVIAMALCNNCSVIPYNTVMTYIYRMEMALVITYKHTYII